MKYAKKYTFSWRTPGTFSRIDPVLGHNTSLNKFEEAEIMKACFYFKNKINI